MFLLLKTMLSFCTTKDHGFRNAWLFTGWDPVIIVNRYSYKKLSNKSDCSRNTRQSHRNIVKGLVERNRSDNHEDFIKTYLQNSYMNVTICICTCFYFFEGKLKMKDMTIFTMTLRQWDGIRQQQKFSLDLDSK